jgi:hypothetical protein
MSISIRLIQQRYLMIPLALLIAMYNNFKLNFNENSRTIRLIYLILHDHKRFLSNSIRILIKEKYITFYSEEDQKQSTSSNSISNGPIPDIQSQPLFRSEIVENRVSSSDQDDSNNATGTQECSSANSVDSNLNNPIITSE